MLVAATVLGMAIAWVDSSPGWDDAGITAVSLILVSLTFGYLRPSRAWLFGIVVGVWIPIFNFIINHNFNSLPVILIAFAAAYIGALLRKVFTIDSA